MAPPVLLDLGAARHAINDQGRQHTAVLKVNYAPIEQYSETDDDLRQGPWSDLYSLAAVVHGCLCNDTPLPATLRSIRDRMVPFPRIAKTVKRQFGVEYSPAFVAAVTQALSLRPEDRPQSIDAFLQAMEMVSAPEGIDGFDFRADLGDIWVEPADQPGPGLLTPTVDVTSAPKIVADIQASLGGAQAAVSAPAALHDSKRVDADSGPETVAVEAADTVFMDPGDTVMMEELESSSPSGHRSGSGAHREVGGHASKSSRSASASHESSQRARAAVPRRHKSLRWGAVAAVAFHGGGECGLGLYARKAPVADDIITEMAEPPAALTLVEASAPVASASVASEVAVAEPGLVEPPLVAASASQPAPAPKPVVRNSAAAKKVAPEPAPAPVVAVEAPPPPPPPPPEPKPRPAPAKIPTPQEVCANAGFLAKPMCIHQECQKPSQVGQAICVENRKRYEAEEQRARQMGN